MRIPHRFLPTASFIFILFQYLLLASSQSNSPAAVSATSSFPASSSSTVSAAYNFTYPTFPDRYGSGIEVSYKDTIDVSWTANGVQHSPELEIRCWNRNDSSSFIYYQNPSSYTHTLFTSSTPSDPSYDLALGPYRKYSPCQLLLQDPSDTSGETVTSVAIFISQATNASTDGVTWSADDPAPKVAVDAGVGTVNSRGARLMDRKAAVGGVIWVLAGTVAGAMVLL